MLYALYLFVVNTLSPFDGMTFIGYADSMKSAREKIVALDLRPHEYAEIRYANTGKWVVTFGISSVTDCLNEKGDWM